MRIDWASVGLAALASAIVSVTLYLVLGALPSYVPPVRSVPGVVVHEDEPGWDCRTMGNRICGPGA